MKRSIGWAAAVALLAVCSPVFSAGAAGPATDRLLPQDFTVHILANGGVVNWAAPGTHPVTLPTHNLYRGPGGGYVACYSHSAASSAYSVGGDVYVMGQMRLRGRYDGRIFQPRGYQGKDISAAPYFKQLCGQAIEACGGGTCWAGGDTGGWFGIQ